MLSLRYLSKKFGNFALQDVNLEIEKGEYFVLAGPSGAGKSLLFELIAGIYQPDRGEIVLNGTEITRTSIDERNIGLVFQDNTLFPNYSVYHNIAYSLKIKKNNKSEIRNRVEQLAEELNILPLLDRELHSLSGGEIQRVSLARALASEPEYLLLDEPVSSLDVKHRDNIIAMLRTINKSGLTVFHITHNLTEAVYLADRMAIIDKGRIIQADKPENIFNNPASVFVAHFLGYKNIFHFKKHTEGIQIENNLVLKMEKVMMEVGMIVIPDRAISIFPGRQAETNTYNFSILEKTSFPDHMEIILDAGLQIHKKIPGNAFNYKKGRTIKLKIDNSKLMFLPDE